MTDKDWDKELAKIDRQLASISDEQLVSPPAAAAPVLPAGAARAPAAASRPAEAGVAKPSRMSTVFFTLRMLLALTLAVAILWWPYESRCGTGLFAYLGAVGMVAVAGIWTGVWSWKRRSPVSHILSILIVLWGIVLASVEVLPRTGYGRPSLEHPANWTCVAPVPGR